MHDMNILNILAFNQSSDTTYYTPEDAAVEPVNCTADDDADTDYTTSNSEIMHYK